MNFSSDMGPANVLARDEHDGVETIWRNRGSTK